MDVFKAAVSRRRLVFIYEEWSYFWWAPDGWHPWYPSTTSSLSVLVPHSCAVQVLEGPKAYVHETFKRIQSDSRHDLVSVVLDAVLPERQQKLGFRCYRMEVTDDVRPSHHLVNTLACKYRVLMRFCRPYIRSTLAQVFLSHYGAWGKLVCPSQGGRTFTSAGWGGGSIEPRGWAAPPPPPCLHVAAEWKRSRPASVWSAVRTPKRGPLPNHTEATPATSRRTSTPYRVGPARTTFHTPQSLSPMSPRVSLQLLASLELVAMEGEEPLSPRKELNYETSSQEPHSDASAPGSPSTASTMSCSTEGSRCLTP